MNRTGRVHPMLGGGALVRACLMVLALAAILAAATPIHATTDSTIIYVVPGGTGDGTTWDKGKDLAAALSGASSDSELWVKAGTYKPTSGTDRSATFALKNNVAIYGGFAGTETTRGGRNWQTNVTTLSGDIGAANDTSDNSYHVVTGSGTDATAILDGLTVSGGYANGSYPDTSGAGMYNVGGSPTLTNVVFSGNVASSAGYYNGLGGGMYTDSGGRPTLTNVVFSGNAATAGGGMYNYASAPTLTNVVFSGNAANYGGGLYNDYNCSSTLTNVTFSGNSAYYYGGGLYSDRGSSTTVRNGILWGDSAAGDPEISQPWGGVTLSYSIVQGGYSGAGNRADDPLFVSPITASTPTTTGNLRLQAASPAINVGDNNVTNPALPAIDLDGNSRIAFGTVDMGAYEAQVIANPTQSPAANAAGWNNSDVTVTWNWSDGSGAGLDTNNCTTSSTSSGEGTLTLTAQCKNLAGSIGVASHTVKVDKTVPTANPTSSPAANSAGWNNTDVTVTWNWSDAAGGAGLDTTRCPTSSATSGEGSSVTVSADCYDLAGNKGAETSQSFKIDATKPTLIGAPTTQPNSAGWYKGDVTVAWTCSDALSGIVGVCPPNSTISSEGTDLTASARVSDQAGNTTNAVSSPAVKIDKTKPTIVAAATTQPNSAGWYNGPVTVRFICNDGLSGIPTGACPSDQVLSAEGSAVSSTPQTVTDAAGNVSDPSNVVTVKIDKTKPTINITAPASGVVYPVGASLTASFACSDALSQVQTCMGTLANGSRIDTSTPGAKTFAVNATDNAGNTNSVTVGYVVGYAVGYVSPTDGSHVNELVVTGMGPWTTPVKWTLKNNVGQAITAAGTVKAVTYKPMTCGGTTPDPSGAATAGGYSGTNPKYDTYQKLWVFNWQLSGKECYALYVTLDSTQVLTLLYNVH
ncbi:MAG: choice-of-anchor Q domain-containing protein [Anaerolineae bacterium]